MIDIEKLRMFRRIVIAKKENKLNNLSNVTKNQLTVAEVQDAINNPLHVENIEFYCDNAAFVHDDFVEIMTFLSRRVSAIVATTDNGYDFLINLIDEAIKNESSK